MPKILPTGLVSPIRRLHGFLEWLREPPYGDIDRLIRAGFTTLETAYYLGITPKAVQNYTKRWGLPINPARWKRESYARRLLRQLDDGWTLAEVGALNMMSPAFLYRVVSSAGLEIPAHHLKGYEREVATAIPGHHLHIEPPVLPPEWIDAHTNHSYSKELVSYGRLRHSRMRALGLSREERIPKRDSHKLSNEGPGPL